MKGHQGSLVEDIQFNMICIYFLIDNFTFLLFTYKNTVCVEILFWKVERVYAILKSTGISTNERFIFFSRFRAVVLLYCFLAIQVFQVY